MQFLAVMAWILPVLFVGAWFQTVLGFTYFLFHGIVVTTKEKALGNFNQENRMLVIR